MRNSNTLVMNGKPFVADIGKLLCREIRTENDANCLALSEAVDGAAAGAASVFAVILGTGVGGGLVIDGKLVSGRNKIAGEWGHIPLPLNEIERRLPPRALLLRAGRLRRDVSLRWRRFRRNIASAPGKT